MRQLVWKLVLPLTITSFAIFSKWWRVAVVDGANEVLTGFPLPFMCPGWHTSLSLQIFVSALIIDVITYFAFWFLILFLIHRFVWPIRPSRVVTLCMLSASSCVLALLLVVACNPDNVYSFRRKFEMQVMETGYKFIWEPGIHPYEKNQ